MLNPAVNARASELGAQFQRREPFRNVVIDEFFGAATPAHADRAAQLMALGVEAQSRP